MIAFTIKHNNHRWKWSRIWFSRTVLKLYTTVWLPRLTEIVELIAEQVPHEHLILRLSRNIQDKALLFTEGQFLRGAPLHEPGLFLETGIRFEVDGVRGQKTGFYLDQRENRRLVESLSAGRRVLNAFSFSGGFSLYAARGGAALPQAAGLSPWDWKMTRFPMPKSQSSTKQATFKRFVNR